MSPQEPVNVCRRQVSVLTSPLFMMLFHLGLPRCVCLSRWLAIVLFIISACLDAPSSPILACLDESSFIPWLAWMYLLFYPGLPRWMCLSIRACPDGCVITTLVALAASTSSVADSPACHVSDFCSRWNHDLHSHMKKDKKLHAERQLALYRMKPQALRQAFFTFSQESMSRLVTSAKVDEIFAAIPLHAHSGTPRQPTSEFNVEPRLDIR